MAVAACLLAPIAACAQHWNFQSYGADAGLTNPTILAVQQDSQGYLWISTEGGLFRYDGDRFRAFDAYMAGKVGAITSLHLSGDGQLWAAAAGVIFRWTGSAFVPVPGLTDLEMRSSQALASDAERLYVASISGLWSIPLLGAGTPQQLTTASAGGVYVSRDKTVWFGCGSGLCSIRNGRAVETKSSHPLPGGPWDGIAEDSGGQLWIRSAEAVYSRGVDGNFREVSRFASIHRAGLTATRGGEVLVPHTAGLAICSLNGCRNYGWESGLQPSEVIAVGEDREGSLWLGYSGQGLARWLGRKDWQSFTQTEGLTDSQIWRIVRARTGDLWIGTNHGLFHGSEKDGRWHFSRSPLLKDWTVYGLVADPDGSLWLGTFQPGLGGLVHYDPGTGRTIMYPPPIGMPRISVTDLSRDSEGSIWVTGGKSILRLKPGSTRLEVFESSLPDARAYQVLSRSGVLYFATRKGLYVERSGRHYLLTAAAGLKDNAIQSLAAGRSGEIWIAYFGPLGITRLNWEGEHVRFHHFGTADGLPSNTIYSQFVDARGVHWIGTDNGAATLEGNRWVQFDTTNGLVWNDCNVRSYLAEPDGTAWIGTSAGLSRYFPVPHVAPPVPSTLVTSVLSNDTATSSEVFDSSTRSVALRFTMLSYRQQRPLFRYRLGSNGSWLQTRAREVRFAELPPGTYHFEVQGEIMPGTWSTPASRDFKIRAPWYRGSPFLAGALSAVTALIWLGWRKREACQRRLRAELELAVEERTRSLAAATARAEEESRCKGQFLANMSHEMRTPLNGVIGLTKLALDSSNQPEVINHLTTVQSSAKLLLSLINDILDLAKMEAGKLEIVPIAFAPRLFFEEARAMFEADARSKGVTLSVQCDRTVPEWITADDCRLRQVIVNLLGNAIKFTQTGSVLVNVWHDGAQLRCAVSDTGVGIDRVHHRSIFDMFQQADNSTSRRHGGTGLGLSISLKLVQSMGGTIEVESEPGCGSTFSFGIVAPAAMAQKTPAALTPEASVRPMRILVAEDNKVNQFLLLSLLRKRGHVTLVAENGREAIAVYQDEPLDLIFMDIQMPEVDGIEAVRVIRQSEANSGRRIPVIAVTARAMPGDRDEILAAGMDEYLDKPIHTERLDAILGRFALVSEPGEPGASPQTNTSDWEESLELTAP